MYFGGFFISRKVSHHNWIIEYASNSEIKIRLQYQILYNPASFKLNIIKKLYRFFAN